MVPWEAQLKQNVKAHMYLHVFGNENFKTFQRTKSTLSSLFTNVFLKTQYAN